MLIPELSKSRAKLKIPLPNAPTTAFESDHNDALLTIRSFSILQSNHREPTKLTITVHLTTIR